MTVSTAHVLFNTLLLKTKPIFYVRSCWSHFVGIALKLLGYNTKPRLHLALRWNMDHSIPPTSIWKSVHKPGIGFSAVKEQASRSSFPGPAPFSVPSPCARKTTRGLSSCENLSDLSCARKAWSSLPYTAVQAGWIVGWSKGDKVRTLNRTSRKSIPK